MIPHEEARAILSHLDAGDIARRTWRAAAHEDGSACYAATVLDLRTGKIRADFWPRESILPRDWGEIVVIGVISASRREDTEAEAARGASVPPSADVVEEGVVERARKKGLAWDNIEEQLRRSYGSHGGDQGAA